MVDPFSFTFFSIVLYDMGIRFRVYFRLSLLWVDRFNFTFGSNWTWFELNRRFFWVDPNRTGSESPFKTARATLVGCTFPSLEQDTPVSPVAPQPLLREGSMGATAMATETEASAELTPDQIKALLEVVPCPSSLSFHSPFSPLSPSLSHVSWSAFCAPALSRCLSHFVL